MKHEINSTDFFNKWFVQLRDSTIKQKILARFARVENGNFGDFKQLGPRLFELRFVFAGGLRIYYTIQDGKVVLLLAGGDKSNQSKDIAKAEQLLHEQE